MFELPLQRYARSYSTGMKKKLALTGILLQRNEFVILDEPFNGVDIQSNILISEIIRQLRALGKCVLISSHIFATLKDSCDEIHLLREGQLVKKVLHHEFALLEQEMMSETLGRSVDRLELS